MEVGIYSTVKVSYKHMKRMKKYFGKLYGREIAFGRTLCKYIQEKYQPERLNPEASKEDSIV